MAGGAQHEAYEILYVSDIEQDSHAELWRRDSRFTLEASSSAQASGHLSGKEVDAIVWRARTFENGMEKRISCWKTLQPRAQIVLVLDHFPTPSTLKALLRAGCWDVLDLAEPGSFIHYRDSLHERITFVRARSFERLKLKQGIGSAGLVGESPGMLKVYEQIGHASRLNCPVLISGESGTGKGVVARAIHALSSRHGKPFVTVDCGCLAPDLMEAELYGAVRGAYTGADSDRTGLVQAAQGGTLFLDEVGELPLPMQPKLLRLLEEREIRQLGTPHSTAVNVRVISATARDLDQLTANRQFRLELYYRLNVLHIKIPPLRQRRQDIPLLVQHFASQHVFQDKPITVTERALKVLTQYYWPGNVRELKNCIEAAVATLTRNAIHVGNLPQRITEGIASGPVSEKPFETLNLRALERQAIRRALEITGNDKTRAAKLLGIGKTTLYRKLKQANAAHDKRHPSPARQAYLM